MSHEKFIQEFKKLYPDRKLLFLCKAGSHFFNLAGPNSDTDYKGVYLPSPKEFYEGESRRRFWERTTGKDDSKNSKDDVDVYLFSYTFFLDLLSRGDFNCMELLYCSKENIIHIEPEFKQLVEMRKALMVNDVSAFLGFIKKEYRRYGVNINHYNEQQKFSEFLKQYPVHTRLRDIWKDLEQYAEGNDYIIFTTSLTGKNNEVPTIKVAQRMYQNTVTIDYVYNAIDKRLDRYGHRQKNMAASGVEFKGLYHALRLIYEANDLFDYGEFKLPFDKTRWFMLKSIKEGNINQDFLFELIDEEIDKLQAREKEVSFNKDLIKYRTEKLKFIMEGKKKLEYLCK